MTSSYMTGTLTFTRRQVAVADGEPVQDAYGNDVYTDVPFTVTGCTWEPRGSSENTDRVQEVRTGLTVYCQDPNVDVRPQDKASIGGRDYEVEGEPERWTGSLFGHDYAEIALQRVTGGPAT